MTWSWIVSLVLIQNSLIKLMLRTCWVKTKLLLLKSSLLDAWRKLILPRSRNCFQRYYLILKSFGRGYKSITIAKLWKWGLTFIYRDKSLWIIISTRTNDICRYIWKSLNYWRAKSFRSALIKWLRHIDRISSRVFLISNLFEFLTEWAF